MDKSVITSVLRKMAAHDAAIFARRLDIHWVSPVARMMHDLRSDKFKTVLFGGCIRSMVLSRLNSGRPGRPRDIDLVVQGESIEQLRKDYSRYITRETRFGGLQLQRDNWHFDIWPLEKTNAFVEDKLPNPSFDDLPSTTFLNLEAIAVDLWAPLGRERKVYSGNNAFFDGLVTRTLEINRDRNPFPLLCVVRALIFSSQLDFSIGEKLSSYIIQQGSRTCESELAQIQEKHYGTIRRSPRTLVKWINLIRMAKDKNPTGPIRLPIPRQQTLFPEHELEMPILRLKAIYEKHRNTIDDKLG